MKRVILFSAIILNVGTFVSKASGRIHRVCSDNTVLYTRTVGNSKHKYLSKDTEVLVGTRYRYRTRVRILSGNHGYLDNQDICKVK